MNSLLSLPIDSENINNNDVFIPDLPSKRPARSLHNNDNENDYSILTKATTRGSSCSVTTLNEMYNIKEEENSYSGTGRVLKKSRSQPLLAPLVNSPRPEPTISAEDKKKQKLVRNRAAARLRRIKQKTLTESLEREIKKIEETIQILNLANIKETDLAFSLKEINTMNYPNIATHSLRTEEIKFNLKELNNEIISLKSNINDMVLLPISQTQTEYLTNPLFLDLCNVLKLTPQQVNELQSILPLCMSYQRDFSHLKSIVDNINTSLADSEILSLIEDLNESFRSTLSDDQVTKYFNFLNRNESMIRSLLINPPISIRPNFVFT